MQPPRCRASPPTSYALALAVLMGLALCAPAACAARRLHQGFGGSPPPRPQPLWTSAPGNLTAQMASCAWTGYECQYSMAPALSASQPLINSANYPAWAQAYVAATDLFCSQFSEDQCQWPCAYNGISCQMDGHLYYDIYNCDSSLASADNFCSQEPQARSKASCLSNPECSWSAEQPLTERCMSTYATNLTNSQRTYVFGDLYWNVMPRQLLGCCKGSTYLWQVSNFCDAAFDNSTGIATQESCAKVPGCTWDIYSAAGCVPSAQTQLALQFAYQPSDPVAATLTKLAGECQAIKDAQTCSGYKPMAVDKSKVQAYMDQMAVEVFNAPVVADKCPLPSVPPPWV